MLTFEEIPARYAGAAPGRMLAARAKVPGGWLVRLGSDGHAAFVPDPEHKWDGSSLP